MKLLPLAFLCAAFAANAQQYERNDRPRADDRRQVDDRRDDRRDERYEDGDGDDIQLMCFGQAENTRLESRSGVQWNPSTHRYEEKSEVLAGKHDFDTGVTISIHGEQGRIRIPKQLIPPLNSGGNDGWWNIDDLLVGHNEIRGRFRLNALNRPTISIDRRSGMITVDGMIKFNGRCDQDTGHRRF